MRPQSVSGDGTTGLAVSWTSRRRMLAAWLVAAFLLTAGGAALLVYAGVYNISADIPHSQPVYWLLQTVRQRSIAVRARDVVVPADLDNPKRIASGAAQYTEMCSGCHLAPGMERTEISQGLYPRAPELRRGSQLRQDAGPPRRIVRLSPQPLVQRSFEHFCSVLFRVASRA